MKRTVIVTVGYQDYLIDERVSIREIETFIRFFKWLTPCDWEEQATGPAGVPVKGKITLYQEVPLKEDSDASES